MVGHDFHLTKQARMRKIMVGHDFPLIWENRGWQSWWAMIFISPSKKQEENFGGSWYSSHLRGWGDNHGGPWFSSHEASKMRKIMVVHDFPLIWEDGVIIMVGHDFHPTKKQEARMRKIMAHLGHDFHLIWDLKGWGDNHGGPWFSSHQARSQD